MSHEQPTNQSTEKQARQPKISEADAMFIAHKLIDIFQPVLDRKLDDMARTVPAMVRHTIYEMTATELRHLIRDKVKDVSISALVTVDGK